MRSAWKVLRGRVDPAGAVSCSTGNHRSKLCRVIDRPMAGYILGNAVCQGFFAIDKNEPGKLGFRHFVDYISCSQLLVGIEPHIQRPAALKTEPSLGAFQLKGRKSEVKKNAVYRVKPGFLTNLIKIIEIIIDDNGIFEVIVQAMLGYVYCFRIGIDAETSSRTCSLAAIVLP